MKKILLALALLPSFVFGQQAQRIDRVATRLDGGPLNGAPVSGTGTSGQCALWNSNKTITGDAGCTWAGTGNTFILSTHSISFFNPTGGSVGLTAATGSTSTANFTLPLSDGTANFGLGTDGSGNLGFHNYLISGAALNNPTIGIAGTAKSAHISTVGTAPTCAFTTGGGTGSPTCALDAGSTDAAGIIILTTGSSPGSTGTVTLTLNSAYVTNNPVIVLTGDHGGGAWATCANFQLTTESLSAPVFTWSNFNCTSTTGVALSNATTYKIAYVVIGKT